MKRAWLALLLVVGCSAPSQPPKATCASCHAEQQRAWEGSHHDLALQEPTPATVLGDFGPGQETFLRRDGGYYVRAEGGEYRVRYLFGVDPLQQLLLEMPDGRLQAFHLAWDTRKKRWFELENELDWKSPGHNWNQSCADCHSTGVRKGYAEGVYHTTFAQPDVSCQACHGQGEGHPDGPMPLGNAGPRFLGPDPKTGSPRSIDPTFARQEAEVCGRCHSLRHQLREDWQPGQPLMDAYLPELLVEEEYFADGQQKGEVFTYGSFLQSKMYRAGVACTDCHEPHSLKLRAEGDKLCLSCHQTDVFAGPGHSHHEDVSCVDCHAPARTYMQVDPRHDHSFRIPRPDLSQTLGSPNACNQCHQDREPAWAAAALRRWYPHPPPPHFGEAIQAGRQGAPDADARLARLAGDPSQPGIARATALTLLGASGESLQALLAAVSDEDPLVRHAAVTRLAELPSERRVQVLAPLLSDPVRAVRMQAAFSLADAPLPEKERGLAEFLETQILNADQPESHLSRALLLTARGRPEEAERAYLEALRLDPGFAPAYVNRADLRRADGKEDEAAALLREGLKRCQETADLEHALGLCEIRRQNLSGALPHLRSAWEKRPRNAAYGLVYALALDASGKRKEAKRVLRGYPGHAEARATLESWR